MSTETTPAPAATAPPTRRERQRQATYDEIVTVARQILRGDETLSLRAIAQEMGMTPPALYRYVDGYDELLGLVCAAVFDDIVASMERAAAGQADDDPGAQLVSAAVAFRQWSLAHPEEFGLIFASRATANLKKAGDPPHGEGGAKFTEFFSLIYQQVHNRYHFALPHPDEMQAGLADGLEAARAANLLPCEFPDKPIGMHWLFMRAWARLYGTVTLEVFGHIDQFLIDSAALFNAMMEDNGADLNLGDDWPRLRQVIDDQLAHNR